MSHNAEPHMSAAGLGERFPPAVRKAAALLERQAPVFGDKPLFVIGDHPYSCEDIRVRAGEMAGLLSASGVKAGDRVAILCGNRIEFLDLFLACGWLGAVAVPINRSSRGPQLEHILRSSGAQLLVIEQSAAEVLNYVDPKGLALKDIWLLPEDGSPAVEPSAWKCSPMPARGAYMDPVESAPSDTCAIIYTSGTTGPSKGVCCPHAQFFWWGANGGEILEIGPDDVLLTTLPLFHVNALGAVFQALISGATIVVLDRFSASGFAPSLVKHGATLTYLLGAMVPILLATPPGPDDRAHRVRRALAPGVPAAFNADFEARFGIGLIDGYGSTETNFVIGDRLADQKPGSMGRVRPGYSARVVGEDDHPVAPGAPGELVVRSDIPHSMASGYFGMPEATLESRRELWFHTGDRVYQEADGRFYFMDRLKDAIRRRGENISAYEVEQVLLSHPAVANAAVFPVASELAEDEVMAALVLQEGAGVTPEALLDFCQPRMTYFSMPRYLLFTDALPMTDNGKVQKFRLRDRGVTPDTWDRERAGYVLRRAG
jgi:crotonobetaine/carnitine-CoA ligase